MLQVQDVSVLEVGSDHFPNTDLRTVCRVPASVLCGNWSAGDGHYMIGLTGFSTQTGRYLNPDQRAETRAERPLNDAESKHFH